MAITYSLKEAAEIMACNVHDLIKDIKKKRLLAEKKKISPKKAEYIIKEVELIKYAKAMGIELVFEEPEEVLTEEPEVPEKTVKKSHKKSTDEYKSLKEVAEIIGSDIYAVKSDIKNGELKAEKRRLSGKRFEYVVKEDELVKYAKKIGLELVFEDPEPVIEKTGKYNYKSLKEVAEIIGSDIYAVKSDIKSGELKAEKKRLSGKRFEYIVREDELIKYAKKLGIELVFEEPEEREPEDKPQKTEKPSPGRYKSLKEVAEIIGSDIYSVKSDIKNGELKAEKKRLSGKRFEYMVKEDELVKYAKKLGIELVFEEPEEGPPPKEKPQKQNYRSLKEVAELLDSDIYTLKSDIKDGELEAEKKRISGKRFEYIIKEEELIRYAKELGVELDLGEPDIEEEDDDEDENLTIEEKAVKYDTIKKELKLANRDFNEQAEEYDNLLKDYEKLEEDKFKQDTLISEAEQTILVMVEQYSELAEDTYSRDKKIAELKKELEEVKKGNLYELTPEDKKKLEDYERLKDDYQLVLMEKQKLYMEMQSKNRHIDSITNIHLEIAKLQEELTEAREYIKCLEEEKSKLLTKLRDNSAQVAAVRNIYVEIEKLQKELTISRKYIDTLENKILGKDRESREARSYKKMLKRFKKAIQENEDIKESLLAQEKELEEAKTRQKSTDSEVKAEEEINPFPGNFADFATLRLVAYLVDNKSSGRISFNSAGVKGELYVTKGNILHATYNNWEGDLALAKFLALEKGNFDFDPEVKTKKITVKYTSTELLEDFIENRTEKVNKLIDLADVLISPDKPLKIKRNWLEADTGVRPKKFQIKILSLISQGKETVNKLSNELNSKQIKVAEAVYSLIKSDLIAHFEAG